MFDKNRYDLYADMVEGLTAALEGRVSSVSLRRGHPTYKTRSKTFKKIARGFPVTCLREESAKC